jgi:signal transduction histidine kinase/class 3 adenylate cyclase/ActR/RegA family two-component response regulator
MVGRLMLLKFLTKSLSQVSGKVPLRVVLVVPFVIQVVGAVGLVGYLSFRNGQKAVNNLANQLLNEVNSRIEEQVDHYLDVPRKVQEMNLRAIKAGTLNFADLKTTGKLLWNQIQAFNFTYIHYSSFSDPKAKEGIGAGVFKGRGEIVWIVKEHPDDLFSIAPDEVGNPQSEVRLEKGAGGNKAFNVPPIRETIAAGQTIWTSIFTWETDTKEITIALGSPIYNNAHQLQELITIDISLTKISNFLQNLRIGQTGKAFIMERSGKLVATSSNQLSFTIFNQQAKQILATESTEPLIKSAANYLVNKVNGLETVRKTQQFTYINQGQRQFLLVTPYKDRYGLDWLIVTVVPESDFMAQINANTRNTILLCLGALGVAIAIGILTSRRITRPILQLNQASFAIASGQLDQNVEVKGINELEKLANSFNSMAGQLQLSFEKLEQQNEELKRLDKLKNEFLANTSHELRTPLNGIIGIAESLIDGATGELPQTTQTNLQLIISSGRRLANLVNDIIDFSKLRHKNLELQLKPVDIHAITNLVLSLSQPSAKSKKLQLINAIPTNLPPAEADENRLQQILYNLVGNAIKFTPSGTVEVSAKVVIGYQSLVISPKRLSNDKRQMTNNQGQIAITISDTGIGIPSDKFDSIFESFEQAEGSTARVYGGTGLGLAVTKQLVELHGGEISVNSKVGEGSQFTFTLPISHSQVASTPEIPVISDNINLELITSKNLQSQIPHGKEFKVLIVDDEPVNRQVLVNNLSLYDYTLSEASNGQEALELIENGFIPDIILLDIMMPQMTGYEVCQQIRLRYPAHELPIVMLTAKNQVEDIVEGFESGANDYLCKPIQKREMLSRIKTHLNLAKITLSYNRFVPHNFLKFLEKESIIDVKLGDQVQQEMTILFSDIRSFTTLSEEMSPQETFNFINSYLSRVSPLIREHNGFIDKYIGDAIMALFPESADDAVQAALAMQKEVTLYNEYQQQQGYPSISIGIGLHTGNLILGTIGESERMETTVIADAVNLASRLEGLTNYYGAGILVSEHTLSRLSDLQTYSYRLIDRVRVKGKNEPVAIYELYQECLELFYQLKSEIKTKFEQAIVIYNCQDFREAIKMFEEVLAMNPHDKAAILYIKRCQHYQQYGVEEGWKSVTDLDFK